MPEGKFSKTENKKLELTRQEIERNLEISGNSFATESETELLFRVGQRDWCNFIIDENFKVFFSLEEHNFLLTRINLNKKDCLVSSGSFHIDGKGKLYFLFLVNLKKTSKIFV